MSIDYHSQRRLKNFNVRKVREALPEFYTTEFPTLVTFLDAIVKILLSQYFKYLLRTYQNSSTELF